MASHITRHEPTVTRPQREALNGHRSIVLWFTGLSGTGKSTIAHAVEKQLYLMGYRTFVFDGDNVRYGLCSDLGFSQKDRAENIRRIGEMVKLFIEAGTIALTAFISPYRADRERVRQLVSKEDFVEIYCRCPIQICEERDIKGLYRQARKNQIQEFTGISAPYEEPETPDLILDTHMSSLDECVNQVIAFLDDRKILKNSISP